MATRPSARPGVYTAIHYAPITLSDSADFANGPCTAIYCGGAGILQVVRWDDTVVPFTVVAGVTLNIVAKRVNSTSSTSAATTLPVALY